MQSPNSFISLKDVSLCYGQKRVLKDVNLVLHQGDFMLVTGANGGGKTSLLRLMLGLQKPTEGEVIHSETCNIYSSNNIGYLPQRNKLDSKFPLSVREVIESGLVGNIKKQLTKRQQKELVDEIIEILELGEIKDNLIGEISGGQFQRTLFGRAIISKPTYLVLDEPTSYLDMQFTQKLFDILYKMKEYCTIVVVLHNIQYACTMANRFIKVSEGSVKEVAAPA